MWICWAVIFMYFTCRFINIEIRNVKFEESLFENCYFEDIRSTDTFFENCTLKNTVFYNTGIQLIHLLYILTFSPLDFWMIIWGFLSLTGIFVMFLADLWEDSKFIDCKLENTTFLHPKRGCHINFQEENDILIYLVSFLGSLSVIPGNIVAGLLMDKIGRLKIIGEWFHETVMALSITLNGFIVSKWTVCVCVCLQGDPC